MKPVVIHSLATQELEEALSFYEDQREGLGKGFLAEVERAAERLQYFPTSGAPYKDTPFRHTVLRRFPYILFYMELEEAIWIAAVAHARRRPGYWQDRDYEGVNPCP